MPSMPGRKDYRAKCVENDTYCSNLSCRPPERGARWVCRAMGNFVIRVATPVPLTSDQTLGITPSVHKCLIHQTLQSTPQITISVKEGIAAHFPRCVTWSPAIGGRISEVCDDFFYFDPQWLLWLRAHPGAISSTPDRQRLGQFSDTGLWSARMLYPHLPS